jgi:branched-chain amino acid aminotransferase
VSPAIPDETAGPAAAFARREPALVDGAAFIDGQIVPVGLGRIPILEVGFAHADVTYDVVAVWHGRFFRLDDHLDRFERGCRKLSLTPPQDRGEIKAILHALVSSTGLRESYVNLMCTRGVAEAGNRDPRQFKNRFYAYAIPYVWLLPPEDDEKGMDVVIPRTVRRIPITSVDPTVKNFHWGDLTRGLYEAYDRGARYPVLLDGDDNVTEGPGYNVFALIEGCLITPDSGVLQGITRRTVLELADRIGQRTEIRPLSANALRHCTEMFATSTAGGVMPITTLDAEPVGDGRVGAVTRNLRELYWSAHEDPRYTTLVDYAQATLR